MNTTRVTYNLLTKKVDAYNKKNSLSYKDKGYLMVSNEGGVYWLDEIDVQGGTGTKSLSGTDGSLRSCWLKVIV